jgi:UDP-glucose 4-epimerase
MNNRKYIVTGGAGFIGSWVTRRILQSNPSAEVEIIDNLCSGTVSRIQGLLDSKRAKLHQLDLKDFKAIEHIFAGVDEVYHFAANPDIAKAASDPTVDFYEGTLLTQNMIEAARRAGVSKVVYASGSGVYGDRHLDLLDESEPNMQPISPYGASKLGCEAMLCAYGFMYGIKITCFRFGNVVGGGQTHGVGYDFLRRLRANPEALEILGDGRQTKPYVHVSDVVDAVTTLPTDQVSVMEVYNIAPDDQMSVSDIADCVVDILQIKPNRPRFVFTGGDRGWKGDVPVVLLSAEKARSRGWMPKFNSHSAIRQSIIEMLNGNDAGGAI